MIAHVAEASELSGRVVLWLDPETGCTPALLEAPVRLAAAYGAEVETVAVSEVPEVDDVPVRRVGCAEAADPPFEHGTMSAGDQRFALLTQRYRRIVDVAGNMHGVRVRHTVASGDAVDQISEMCLARGPWNIVALSRMPAFGGHSLLSSLLANVSGATGFLLCGEQRIHAGSRVVVVAEDADRLPPMLRAAERLSASDASIRILIGAETAAAHAELESQARLLTAGVSGVEFDKAGPTFGVPGALVELLAWMKPSLIIARFGGSCLADGRELSRASAATRAPILLVR
jgi:hypothetical protein